MELCKQASEAWLSSALDGSDRSHKVFSQSLKCELLDSKDGEGQAAEEWTHDEHMLFSYAFL